MTIRIEHVKWFPLLGQEGGVGKVYSSAPYLKKGA